MSLKTIKIKKCRLCSSSILKMIHSYGNLYVSNFVPKNKINVYHLGYVNEPILSVNNNYYHNLTKLDFFSQIKISLGSKLALGTDSGSMWVLAAYSHPSITLITNWYDNHNKNFKNEAEPK